MGTEIIYFKNREAEKMFPVWWCLLSEMELWIPGSWNFDHENWIDQFKTWSSNHLKT